MFCAKLAEGILGNIIFIFISEVKHTFKTT